MKVRQEGGLGGNGTNLMHLMDDDIAQEEEGKPSVIEINPGKVPPPLPSPPPPSHPSFKKTSGKCSNVRNKNAWGYSLDPDEDPRAV